MSLPPETPSSPNILPKAPIRRTRKILNCVPCRNSKLKCDRQRPCSSCILRGHPSLCTSIEEQPSSSPQSPGEGMPGRNVTTGATTGSSSYEFRKIRQALAALETHMSELETSTGIEAHGDSAEQRPAVPLPAWEDATPLSVGTTHWTSYIKSMGGHGTGIGSTALQLEADSDYDKDILELLPVLPLVDRLLQFYFEEASWLHFHIQESMFMPRWERFKAGEHSPYTLATACVLIAIAIRHLPVSHALFAELTEGSGPSREELSIRYYDVLYAALARIPADSRGYGLDLVEFLLVRYHFVMLVTMDSEELWSLRGEMVTVGLAIGLHRDPGERMERDAEDAERKRWAWWHIVAFDRYSAFIFGRPPAISYMHFNTRLPKSPSAAGVFFPTIISFFRLSLILGEFVNVVLSMQPVPHDVIVAKDHLLDVWLDSLPSELRFDYDTVARSLSSPISNIRRFAIHNVMLRSLFLHTRCSLHASAAALSREDDVGRMTSLKIAVDAAQSLIDLARHIPQEALGDLSSAMPTYLSSVPFRLFSVSIFLALLIIENHTNCEYTSLASIVIEAADVLNAVKHWTSLENAPDILREAHAVYVTMASATTSDHVRKVKTEGMARIRTLAFGASGTPNLSQPTAYSPGFSIPWTNLTPTNPSYYFHTVSPQSEESSSPSTHPRVPDISMNDFFQSANSSENAARMLDNYFPSSAGLASTSTTTVEQHHLYPRDSFDYGQSSVAFD
ncbi:hypothetical protein OF83DRAFT_806161 [Amylostereum chailletii]|nr:hypothetical protein OF83DRAFT_806161 [Amylostereum chailletii]